MATLGDLLDRVRTYYTSRLSAALRELAMEPGTSVFPEAALRAADGTVVREGELHLPYRVDACVGDQRSVTRTVMVDTEGMLSFEPFAFVWPGGMQVTMRPFRWDYCSVTAEARPDSYDRLREWFADWFKEADDSVREHGELLEAVHFMSDPQADGTLRTLLIDLGSAPVAAFEALLDALRDSGQREITIGGVAPSQEARVRRPTSA